MTTQNLQPATDGDSVDEERPDRASLDGRVATEALPDQTPTPSASIPSGAAGPHHSAETVVVGRVIDGDGTAGAETGPEPEPGARCGRYVILERLGQGGMGVVYGAYDSDLDRRVALKLLRTQGRLAEGVTEGRARLLREAKAMAKLSHPNVVTIHDVGTLAGRIFIAMEYVDGTTLTRWAKRKLRTWQEVRDVFVQAGRGLGAAHKAGLVHRDFKPDNVLVGNDGRVRVTDFGLARLSETTDLEDGGSGDDHQPNSRPVRNDDLTQPGLIMGTPPYMAPEHAVGVPVDHRMDQFSFCVALYEALYKRRPFRGRSRADLKVAMLAGKIREAPRSTTVPSWLHAVVVRGLSAKPSQRWRSMDELVDQLERRPRLRKRLLVGSSIAAAMLGGVAVWGVAGPEQCDGASAHLQGVWDHQRRVQAREGMLAAGRPHAEDSWARVERAIDGYADDWVRMRTQACEATVRGEQSNDLLDLRMACLDRRLEDVSALVDVLGEADPTVVDGATWAAATLPPIEHCQRAEVLTAELAPPQDPEVAAALDELRVELARAGIHARVGNPEKAMPEVRASVNKARTLGDAPLTASSLHLLGVLQHRVGDEEAARDSLSESALMAAAGEHHRVAAAAATAMMGVVGTEDYKQGLLWGWYAEAAVERLGPEGPEEAAMLEGLGSVFAAHDKYEEAREHFGRAIEIRRRLEGEHSPALARTLVEFGDVWRAQGELDRASQSYEQALDATRAAFGASHPELITILERVADTAESAGRTELAARHRADLELLQHTAGSYSAPARHSAP